MTSPCRNIVSTPVKKDFIKSRQRIKDHGEVFTPENLVEEMLDLVEEETLRVESKFLEQACGQGNFLVAILKRKLKIVKERYRGESGRFEREHFALLAMMSLYGIDIQTDNVEECRDNLAAEIKKSLRLKHADPLLEAVKRVLELNVVSGDATTMLKTDGLPIIFPDWSSIGAGKYQRIDYKFSTLVNDGGKQNTVFEFVKRYNPQKMSEVAL